MNASGSSPPTLDQINAIVLHGRKLRSRRRMRQEIGRHVGLIIAGDAVVLLGRDR
jgi:hypothetical protein